MMFCEQCGSVMPDGASFCEACGWAAGEVDKSSKSLDDAKAAGAGQEDAAAGNAFRAAALFCEDCGAPLLAGALFCETCGHMTAGETSPALSYCESCGSALAPGAFFCEACGSMAAGSPQAIATQPTMVMPAAAAASDVVEEAVLQKGKRSKVPLIIAVVVAVVAVVIALIVVFDPFGWSKDSSGDGAVSAETSQAKEGKSEKAENLAPASTQSNTSKMFAGVDGQTGIHSKVNVRVGGEMATLDLYRKSDKLYLELDYSDGKDSGSRQIYLCQGAGNDLLALDPQTKTIVPAEATSYGEDVVLAAQNIQEGMYGLATSDLPYREGSITIGGVDYQTEEFDIADTVEKMAFKADGTPAYYIFSTGDGTGDYVARIDAADGNVPDSQFEIPAGYTEKNDFGEEDMYINTMAYMFPTIEASSELPPDSVTSYYGVYNAFDGDLNTAWNEGSSGDGTGEWIEMSSTSPEWVNGLYMIGGYTKSPELYQQNNRPRGITVSFDDGTSEMFTLDDGGNGYDELPFSQAHYTTYVRITIDSVYKGSKYNDCCISEIEVY